MESRKLIILSLFVLPLSLLSETADDYVHRGAQKYIFGQDDAAEAEINAGLAKFPNDAELREMTTLFRKKQQQQHNQSKGQQNQQQSSGQGQQQKNQPQQNQQTQSQNQSGTSKDSQGQSNQQLAKNEPQKNQQPKPGGSPTPSQGKDQDQPNQPSPQSASRQEQPEESPTPGGGEDQMPSPSPGEGEHEGENASPSATPTSSPQKKFAGEIKGTSGEQQPPQSREQAAQLAEAEPEKDGQMSEKQAELLLRSMRDEEQRVQLDERKVRRHVYNDW